MGILMKHLFNKLFYPNKEDPRVPHQCFEYDFKNISLYDVQYHIGKGHITYAGETMYPIIGYTILSKEVNRSDWPIYKDLFTEEILDNYLVNEAKYQGDKQKHGWKSTEPETFVTKSELGELGKELNEVLVHESNSEKIDEILNILRRIEQRQILSESNRNLHHQRHLYKLQQQSRIYNHRCRNLHHQRHHNTDEVIGEIHKDLMQYRRKKEI
jgi:hypothetical protein